MWRVLVNYVGFQMFFTIFVEHVLLVSCVLASIQIRLYQHPKLLEDYQLPIFKAMLIALIFQLSLHLKDAYDFHTSFRLEQFLARLGQALLVALAILSIIYYCFPPLMVGRGIFVINSVLISIFLIVWHVLLRLYFGRRTPRSRILVLGTGHLARALVREILRRPELGIGVSGFLDDNLAVGTSVVNPKVVGTYAELQRIVCEQTVDRIVVEVQDRRGRLPIDELLALKTRGIVVEEATSLYERVTGKVAIENLKPSWLIFNSGFGASRSMLILQQILSFVVASLLLLLLLLLAPVMLLAMMLIKLDSPGPIFHRQERVGQNGRRFTLWKFRSMFEDAERETGPIWAALYDKRITRVGRFLRRTRVDELPQLWNVVRGDMNLVGPRPERPNFVKELNSLIPLYDLRHVIKPGITGWAQINYRYGNSISDAAEKLQYDLFYIKHKSWLLDSLIILETVKTVLVRSGS